MARIYDMDQARAKHQERLRPWTEGEPRERREFVSVCPALPGWRVLFATAEGIKTAPVACWAVVRVTSGELERSEGVALTGSVVEALQDACENLAFVGTIGPGEQPTEGHRELAQAIYEENRRVFGRDGDG